MRRMIKRLGKKLFGKSGDNKKTAPSLADTLPAPASPAKSPPAVQSAPDVLSNTAHRTEWSLDDFRVSHKEGAVRFHDFDLPDPVMRAVHELGFQYCTPIQQKVLSLVSAGKNIAGRAQTGTGKTAAFLVCIFSRFMADGKPRENRKTGAPRALVLAPTRELVMQIAKDAGDLGKYTPFASMAVFGGMDFDKQLRNLAERPIDLVAATPGRLLDFVGRGAIDLRRVEILVIDEADRMLDMGFIPDVRRIIRATPPNNKRQTMLFSATLTKEVLRLASQWMPDPEICEVKSERVAVDTVNQLVYIVRAREKFTLLYNLLKREEMARVLVFGNRRDSTQRLVDNLEMHGIHCAYLSGAVRQETRMKVLEGFRAGKFRVVVATDVAGRGLHVDNITHVINYDFPYEPEDYVHRIGRTGRAGLAGTSISFACEEESFVIPEIEKYIGEPLKCIMPDQDMLVPLPPPVASSRRVSHAQARQSQPRHSSSSGQRGGRPPRRSGVATRRSPRR